MGEEHDREPTDAERLNTGDPGNPSGKPVTDGTKFDDDDREPITDLNAQDAVWAEAEVSDHAAEPG